MALSREVQFLLERICHQGPIPGVALGKVDLERVSELRDLCYVRHDGKGWVVTERGRKRVEEG